MMKNGTKQAAFSWGLTKAFIFKWQLNNFLGIDWQTLGRILCCPLLTYGLARHGYEPLQFCSQSAIIFY